MSRLFLDRPDVDTHDTRSRIMIEAERLFRHYGYGKTTVADIAREMGMSPGNVYRFFASKAALMEAMAERILADRSAAGDAIVAGPGTAAERLRALLLAEHIHSSELMASDRNFHEMVVIAIKEQWHVIQVFKRQLDAQIARLIEDGIAAGDFPPQDAGRTAQCVNQAYATCCHPMLLNDPIDNGTRASPEQMIDFIVDAIRGARPTT
jgi:AcrR family transcriptional regulator